jgi:hypothetical protein
LFESSVLLKNSAAAFQPTDTVARNNQSEGEMRNSYKFFVGKFDKKRSFGRPRRRWNVNIEINPR